MSIVKGSNVKNGTYYIDQNIENTIAHYNSATFVNPGETASSL